MYIFMGNFKTRPMKLHYLLPLALLIFLLNACQQAPEKESHMQTGISGSLIVTPLGDSLTISRSENPALLEKWEEAQSRYEASPEDADALIWYGRRTAYLGDYPAAIEIFSEGIEKHPEDARMYRHRGHRYISTRQYDKAIQDFLRAKELIQGTDDRVEPDGMPNARNIPTSTLHSNVYYHLALAWYLTGEYEKARDEWKSCLDVSTNPDMFSATANWYYMSLRRLGEDVEADEFLSHVEEGWDIIENQDYYDLLLFYKGSKSLSGLLTPYQESGGHEALLYGAANWHLYNGMSGEAQKIYEELLEKGAVYSFAYLAGEADYQREFNQ